MAQHLDNLFRTCHTFPAIDNHAHPILSASYRNSAKFPFKGVVSEAPSSALEDSQSSLACYRATPQLASLLNIPPDATWSQIEIARDAMEWWDLCRTCFERSHIQCLLLDDGLSGVREYAYEYGWHDKLTTSPTKRIVRVEAIAEHILSELYLPSADDMQAKFCSKFQSHIEAAASDPEVTAFKTVVCYRTGLDVALGLPDGQELNLTQSLSNLLERSKGKSIRLEEKIVNDWVVRTTLDIAGQYNKPVQFHTGIGDPDLLLSKSTPTLLQPLIRMYPKTTFVLLHASYPFTRELGWLAAVYPNVYADFGEFFQILSPQGGRETIKALLEICPTNKLLFSTDGHWWPESFYLGSIQARQALYEILSECVFRIELTEAQAVGIAERALFWNANELYSLHLSPASTD